MSVGVTTDDCKALPCNESFSDFSMGAADQAAKRGPGNSHARSSFFLIQLFSIGKAQRLELIEPDFDKLQLVKRLSGWLVQQSSWIKVDPTTLFGAHAAIKG